jgi:hypothetical protein
MPAAKGKKAGRSATAASSKKKSVGKHKPTKSVKAAKSRAVSSARPKAHAKAQPKKASKAAKPARTTRTPAPRPAAKKPAPAVAAPAAAPRPAVAKPPAPAARTPRKARSRIESSGTPTAAWFPESGSTRPASFIPAPPRAEAPSNVAAPPAMADRVVRASDMTGVSTNFRIHPIRIDIEYSAGRMILFPNPEEIQIRMGEGVEWDFRYTGGADLMIEEIVIELPKGAPFQKTQFRAKKPTAPRHRVFSGAANGSEFRGEYSIRCLNSFKSQVAAGKARIVVAKV